ncbi:MAG: type II toxin-antitoxin system VapC family toxin [Candidatus Levybacteria bacterium]|nr:type II toxin-antitoxin system VapC family toxin [Candidatus Levybacteria bacterium]
MKSYLIETSVIIDYLKGKEQAKILVDSLKGHLTSSYFCLAELYEGIRRVKEHKTHEQAALMYFHSLRIVYGLDMQIAKKFGELRARLKKHGAVIEDIDLFLAATCLVYDLTLVTFNKRHFSHVEELEIL